MQAISYVTKAAEAFGVGADDNVPFDPERAKRDVKGEGDVKKTAKSRAKKDEPKSGSAEK